MTCRVVVADKDDTVTVGKSQGKMVCCKIYRLRYPIQSKISEENMNGHTIARSLIG